MLMRHRELYYRQSKDQRNLQPVYLVEQNNVGFSCRCRCPLGRVRKAQRLPWQEVVRCVDSLCRFVKLIDLEIPVDDYTGFLRSTTYDTITHS